MRREGEVLRDPGRFITRSPQLRVVWPLRMYHSCVDIDRRPSTLGRPVASQQRRHAGLRRSTIMLLTPGVLVLGGCDPIFDIGGAFFPSWIFAVLVGLVATALVREVLVRFRIDDRLFGRGFAYLGLFTCVSILTWIWFFRT